MIHVQSTVQPDVRMDFNSWSIYVREQSDKALAKNIRTPKNFHNETKNS